MRILGLSCDYHDAAAALIEDGHIVAAIEEERLSRSKHDSDLPERAIASCLAIAGVSASELDAVVFHEKPMAVISRVLAARQRRGPLAIGAFAREFPILLKRNLLISYRVETALRRLGSPKPPRLQMSEHHLSHAAAAFYPSPFETAAILTVDGIGEWATATVGQGLHHRIDLLEEQRYPHSFGLAYSLATMWCGFEPNDGEYKLMGLAPFGEPRFRDALDEIMQLDADGSMKVDGAAVKWWAAKPAKLKRLIDLFDGPPRPTGDAPTQRDADLARSVQDFTETAMLRMASHAAELTGETRLCLAGGVALNCVANGRLLRDGPFDEVWIQPAAGDSGSAVGAALWYWHGELGHRRNVADAGDGTRGVADSMAGAALGPAFGDDEVAEWASANGIVAAVETDIEARCATVAHRIADGAVVGWFDGAMEFGPRALGHRSILADPRSSTVQSDINQRVKGRESFRPFAPAVLWEHATEWFDIDRPSPYMLFTFPVADEKTLPVDSEPESFVERVQVARSEIPACTHIDGSARVQTVHHETAPTFHALLTAFHEVTGCPVLLNTSFNRAGEPIVATPDDALATARRAGLDLLVIGSHIITLDHAAANEPLAAASTMEDAR